MLGRHEAQSSTKKILPLKGDTEAVLVARVCCVATNAKAKRQMRHTHQCGGGTSVTTHLAKNYGRRCDESEHGLTNPLLRCEHDPMRSEG